MVQEIIFIKLPIVDRVAGLRNMRPRVNIILLNWNGKELTAECIDSLRKITYPNYEILIADNGSTDGSIQFFKERFSDIELVENGKNLGFAEGNNAGIRRALEKGADHVLLLNNDTIVDPAFLDELVKAIEASPSIAAVGPKVYFYDHNGKKNVISFAGGFIDYWKGKSIHTGEKMDDMGQFDKAVEVDYVEGSCMLVRSEAIKKVGMMDASYFLYWEETEWCVRMSKAGYKMLYVPSSKIWHKIGGSGSSKTQMYYLNRNRIWFMRKYATVPQFLTFLLYFLGYYIPEQVRMLLFQKNFGSIRYLLKGLKDGFFNNK